MMLSFLENNLVNATTSRHLAEIHKRLIDYMRIYRHRARTFNGQLCGKVRLNYTFNGELCGKVRLKYNRH